MLRSHVCVVKFRRVCEFVGVFLPSNNPPLFPSLAPCHRRERILARAECSRATHPRMLSPPPVQGLDKDAALGCRSQYRTSRRGGGTLGSGHKRPKTHNVRADRIGLVPQRPLSVYHAPGKRKG